jgi:hypothetical protein
VHLGAAAQGWHAEGRDPDVTRATASQLSSVILKVQVLLHTTTPSTGMVHFLARSQSGLVEQHTPLDDIPTPQHIVPVCVRPSCLSWPWRRAHACVDHRLWPI